VVVNYQVSLEMFTFWIEDEQKTVKEVLGKEFAVWVYLGFDV
jgi:hypothetical protein